MNTHTPRPRLRYRIKELLLPCTTAERTAFKAAILAATHISESSYSRYLNLRSGDAADMPAFVLRAFARQLSLPMDVLYYPADAPGPAATP